MRDKIWLFVMTMSAGVFVGNVLAHFFPGITALFSWSIVLIAAAMLGDPDVKRTEERR